MSNDVTMPNAEDYYFYHTIELPGQGLIKGPWDLRGREDRYTGYVNFAGKQVLEIGPASGGLTAFMEHCGAVVTCVETSDELAVDILPSSTEDLVSHKEAGRIVLRRVRKAWQFTKEALGLSAQVEYGDVNTLPSQLGRFDVALVGAILVHCKSPFSVMHQACLAARSTVIVTDLLSQDLETMTDSLMRFNPTQGGSLIAWWSFSPGAIINQLKLHGFHDCTTTFHEQLHYPSGDFNVGLQPAKMFTVVGQR